MIALRSLIARNTKIYFRDKGVFLPSLLSPLILLFLFIVFLGNVYRNSILDVVEGFSLSRSAVESIVSGWLISSLLAVCTVTIAFTANLAMVQDRATGRSKDLEVSPAPRSTVALAYFISTFLVTAVVSFTALAAGFVYIAASGWHLSAGDVFATLADTLLLTLFGTALSSVVCNFLRSQGAVVAVQATVSSAYGFLCGAYMPFSNVTQWMRDLLMCLPGSYGTGLLHEHLMGGAIEAVVAEGIPAEYVAALKDAFDCRLGFFGSAVPEWICYVVLAAASLLLVGAYVALCARKRFKRGAV